MGYKYYISKNRRLELKYFCLQYLEWKRDLRYDISGGLIKVNADGEMLDKTAEDAIHNDILLKKIKLVEDVCREAGGELYPWLLEAVTTGCSYGRLRTVKGIPCGKNYYYDIFHRFWFLMSREIQGV